jgi:hypothetical protein
MMRSTIGSGLTLQGDWRRRRGTKTDAHLWDGNWGGHHPFDQRPMCGKRIRHYNTVPVAAGAPCSECLVQAITRRASVPPDA